jgi:hypothetical protein
MNVTRTEQVEEILRSVTRQYGLFDVVGAMIDAAPHARCSLPRRLREQQLRKRNEHERHEDELHASRGEYG